MNIPNRIKILGHWFNINRTKAWEHNSEGEINTWHQIIRISNDELPEDAQAETFLHEILEAIIKKCNLTTEVNHLSLTVISEILFQVIRDNNLDFRTPMTEKEKDDA